MSCLPLVDHGRPMRWYNRPLFRRIADALLVTLLVAAELRAGADASSGVTILARLGILLRHRHPLVAFLVQWVYVFGFAARHNIFYSFTTDSFCLLLVLYGVARRCSRRASIPAALACFAIQVIADWHHLAAYDYGYGLSVMQYLNHLSPPAIPVCFVWMLGHWVRRTADARAAVAAVTAVRNAERQQISRELHEVVTHAVAAMLLQTAGARAVLGSHPERARQALDGVQEAGVQAMAELRRMLTVLRLNIDTAPEDPGAIRWFHRNGLGRLSLPLIDIALIGVALYTDDFVWMGEIYPPTTRWTVTLIDAAVLLTLLARRRWPAEVFLILLTYAVLLVGEEPDSDFIVGPLIALHGIAVGSNRKASLFAAFACTGYLMLWNSSDEYAGWQRGRADVDVDVDELLAALIGFGGVTAVIWTLGHWMRQANQARTTGEALERSRRTERLQTARDLHDIVSHTVTVMLMQAAGARAVLAHDPERALHALDAIQAAGVQATAELRRMQEVMQLPTGSDTDPTGDALQQPGLEQLDTLLQRMRDTGLSIAMHTDGEPAFLDKSVDVTAYRVAQEALTNATKHGGPDCSVDVQLEWDQENLRITVADHAGDQRRRKRTVIPSTGNGLIGLRERVTAIGGQLTAQPSADGFEVAATLPVTTRSMQRAA